MCGAQQLQCNSELPPQIIGAHQPHQACNEYTHVHCFESTVTSVEEGAQQLGQLSHTVRTPQPRDWGSLFNFWIWSGEHFSCTAEGKGGWWGGGAQLLGSRPGCMGFAMQVTTEWKRGHIWDILATVQPHSLGTGDKCTPLVSEFCLEKYSSVLSSVTRLPGI